MTTQVSLLPVKCFTCGKLIAHKLDTYQELCEYITETEALDRLGFIRPCCRRMFLGYTPDLERNMNRHKSSDIELPIEIPMTIKPTKLK